MHVGKKSSSDDKKYPAGSFMGRLRERKIIATLAAFIGGGWFTYEVVHWILVDHYHLPNILKDITIVTFLGALFSTVIWRWFRGTEKRPGNVKVEVLVVPLIILLTLVIDLKFIFMMTGVSINMLLIGIVALCLGIAWVVFKSLQWAVGTPGVEKKIEDLKQIEEKPISFPEWKKSIVILPFEDISPSKDNEYFSDGLTEEIITDLSNIHDLRVISRSSAMMLKASKKAVRDIANEMGVQYLLEGSVRKAGNDIRITAQLIDATSDAHLWADRYGGTLDNVFDIQEKVSHSIVDALKIELSPEESKKITAKPIPDVYAYECYLKALYEISQWTEDGLNNALKYLQNGMELIGENAVLLSGMGYVNYQYVNMGLKEEELYLQKAEEYARRALELDQESPYGHIVLGLRKGSWGGKFQEGIRHFKRALAVLPNDYDAIFWLIAYYAHSGKIDATNLYYERLKEIDPLNPWTQYWPGFFLMMEGRFDLAVELHRKSYELYPHIPPIRWYYALNLGYNHQIDEACFHFEGTAKENPNAFFYRLAAVLALALKHKKQEVFSSLEKSGIEAWARRNFAWSYYIAECYALIDEKETALDWLEISVNCGIVNYPFFNEYDPFLENIRSEPRFKKLMERVKHEWENFEV